MRYRLLACDLDDTMFGHDLVISPATMEALAALRAAQVQVCILSGRFYGSAKPQAQRLGITGLMGVCQGAAVVEGETGRVVSASPLPLQLAKELLQYAEAQGLTAQYYSAEDNFRAVENQYTRAYDALSHHRAVVVPAPLSAQLDFDPLKILFAADAQTIAQQSELLRARYGDRLEITVSLPTYLEFNAPAATKGEALAQIAAYYGVPMAETAAIGDGGNDISMLRAAGLGIAMGNASPKVQAAADRVTARVEEDGFAKAVYRWVLHDNA